MRRGEILFPSREGERAPQQGDRRSRL